MSPERVDEEQVVVTLLGSMNEIVRLLSGAIATGMVTSMSAIVPCDDLAYGKCPLAALLDQDHEAHTHKLEVYRLRLLVKQAAEEGLIPEPRAEEVLADRPLLVGDPAALARTAKAVTVKGGK